LGRIYFHNLTSVTTNAPYGKRSKRPIVSIRGDRDRRDLRRGTKAAVITFVCPYGSKSCFICLGEKRRAFAYNDSRSCCLWRLSPANEFSVPISNCPPGLRVQRVISWTTVSASTTNSKVAMAAVTSKPPLPNGNDCPSAFRKNAFVICLLCAFSIIR